MRLRFLALSVLFFVSVSCSTSKLVPLNDTELKAKLKQHISTLASDAYEGRETGSKGETKSAEYIVKQFKSLGLKAKGTDGYLQAFPFTDGAKIGPSTQLLVNNTVFTNDDFYPLPYTANGIVTGYIARVGRGISDTTTKYDDYLGKANLAKKIFLIESGTPDGNTPHGKYGDWADLRKKIDLAIAHGAAAIIFINSDTSIADPKADWKMRTSPSTIPVVFVKNKMLSLLRDSVITNCTLGVEVEKIEKTGHNILGYLDNGAATTVVIGAHYDHLGYGAEGSLYRGEPAIHSGADDNASGTAAVIELARYLKTNSGLKHNNYLFMAYSGEEKGLLGSNYYVKHPTMDLKSMNYMINMDMIGRLKPDEKTLIINGTGTSSRFKTLMDSIAVDSIKIKQTESGVGPSDHTSFYLQNIPVLHFFSGTHQDYHKPSDKENLINYDGEIAIVKMIEKTIQLCDNSGKLAFVKTKDDQNEDAPKFKVTLGVVPDYAYDGEGMRIDGVTEGRPASKAGLLPGDVVLQIGDYKVLDMMSYMKALSKFTKGETTKLKIKRNNQEIEKDITF